MIILQRGVPFVKGHLMGFPSFTSAIFSPARSKLVARRSLTSDSSYITLAEGKGGQALMKCGFRVGDCGLKKPPTFPVAGCRKAE